jgi:transposase
MFKVGDESESVTSDRDGSRGRILAPEAIYEQAIHTSPTNDVLWHRRKCQKSHRGDSARTSASGAKKLPQQSDWAPGPYRLAAESQVAGSRVVGGNGIYSLDLAFALASAEGIEVAVLNPKVANRFAQTIRRSKTDAADAEVLAEYTHRMPFTA